MFCECRKNLISECFDAEASFQSTSSLDGSPQEDTYSIATASISLGGAQFT